MARYSLVSRSIQRTGALATTFDATPTCIPCNTINQAYIGCQFTFGSSTGAVLKIEFSFDEVAGGIGAGGQTQAALQALTYWRKCNLNIAGAGAGSNAPQDTQATLNTLEIKLPAASENYLIEIPLMATAVRVNAKALTSGAGTSLTLSVIAGRA